MAQRYSENEILTINEDWALDARNNLPYGGQSVQNFIKKVLNSKGGDFYYDSDTSKYLIFADAESREEYLLDRETNADLLLGSFDAPANYTASISMISDLNNIALTGSTGHYIDFTFNVESKDGMSTGESVIVTFTFNNGGNIKRATQVYDAGESVHFLIDPYISEGANTVNIVVTGRNTLASAMAVAKYTLITLVFTSTFNFAKAVEQGDYLSVPYYLEGAGVKYVEWYIDGVVQQTVDTISDLRATRTKNIITTGLSLGKHNVQVRAYIVNDGDNFYSETLYFDFIVAPEDEDWLNNITYVLLGLSLPAPITSTISIDVKQYEQFDYLAAVYDNRHRALTLVVNDNNSPVQSVQTYPEEVAELSYQPTVVGVHTLTFTSGGASASMSVEVEDSNIGIEEVTTDLLLKLSAKGRTNSESNPAVWTYGNTTTSFISFDWNEQSGWSNGALIIPKNSSIEINFAPLSGNPITNGRTIEIDYETDSIFNDNASVLSLVNSQTNAGLTITASSATLTSSGGASVNTKYRDGDRVHLTFIINRTVGDNSRLMFIVNNGILERAESFAASDSFTVSNNLHIGSDGCNIKLHSLKVYDRALSIEEAFCNYAVDSDNLLQIANNNDILNETTGQIDADKVNTKLPIMIITGDMEPIFAATDKNTTVYVDVEYRNMQDATKNFTATHLRLRPQGTSSLGYPRKNLRLYTSPSYGCTMTDANGNVIEGGLYAFKDRAQPVNCWTLKADYAESSGSHNTGVARLWNTLMYNVQVDGSFVLRTEAQKAAVTAGYNYDVRTTVDGFPMVVFYRPTAESQLICLGQYNFNNDKSTEKVFGFTDIPGFDNTNVQCFEFLDSSQPIALFTDISDFDTDWKLAFESRYPDTKTPNLVPLKTLATWINACANNQTKWNNEKSNHFDLPKLAAYYVYLMRFGAVDQTVKNSMITTEDGVHWFFINYDNDTILGIDNASKVFNAWNYDRQSIVPVSGEYYYAGHDSVLWNCFEADPECMTLVRTIDDALYSAGLTYANMIKMFDEEQCDKWCERIYNDNGNYKYIQPFKDSGAAVLYMLQGSRKSYRHWWLQHRMDMYDSMWVTGAYKTRQAIIRFIGAGNNEFTGHSFTITSAIDSYYGYGINGVVQESGINLDVDDTHTFTFANDIGIGNPVNVYNANNLSKIQLHDDSISLLYTFDITNAVGNGGGSLLKSLILGDGVAENNSFTAIGGLQAVPGIEEIDIRGFKAITNMELGNLRNLHVFKAVNSGLTSFAPANSAILTDVSLPITLQTLSLVNNRITSLDYTPTTTLRSVELRNLTGTWATTNAKTFVNTWLAMLSTAQIEQASLVLTGINWSGMTLAQVFKLAQVPTRTLRGRVSIPSVTESEYNQLVETFGIEAFDPENEFYIDVETTSVFVSGPTALKENHTYQFVGKAFPVSDTPLKYLLYNGTSLVSPLTDAQNRVYRKYGSITLYEATGVAIVDNNISTSTSANIRVQFGNEEIYSSYLAVTSYHLTNPSSITISGDSNIILLGNYEYTKAFNTNTYTADLLSVTWSLSDSSKLSISSYTNDNIILSYLQLPTQETTVTLTCSAIFEGANGNVTVTGTKAITLQYVPITSFGLSGPRSIMATGNYSFYVNNILPDPYNFGIASLSGSVASNDGLMSVSANGTEGVTLNVTTMPSTTVELTLTVIATLTNNTTVTSTKTLNFGGLQGYECIFKGNGSTSVQLILNSALSTVTSMEIDGVSITPVSSYTFGDTQEHIVHIVADHSSTTPSHFFATTMSTSSHNYNLLGCTIGSGVKSISNGMFMTCHNLKYVIASTQTSMGDSAFLKCYSLVSFEVPTSMTSISTSNTFNECNNLEYLSVEAGNTVYSSPNDCNAIIQTANNTLLFGSSHTIIPNTVTTISTNAFHNREKLTEINIPDSVTNISGTGVFAGCANLTKVNITDLTKWCQINFHTSDKSSNPLYHAHSLYLNGTKITNLVIPSSITTIKYCQFVGLDASSVDFQNVTLIQDYAFNSSLIPSITIPNTVTTIGSYVFQDCTQLASATLGTGVNSVSNSCFRGCSSLTSITIPANYTSLGDSSFRDCTSLTTVTFNGNNIASQGFNQYVFYGCTSLESFTIPTTLTRIPQYCFSHSGLTSITIPSNITAIGEAAFSYTNLTSITIPSTVTGLGTYVFQSCYFLQSAIFQNTINGAFPTYILSNCRSLTSITFPSGITSIGNSALEKCIALTSLTIPEGVTRIENYGLQGQWSTIDGVERHSALSSLTLPSTLTYIGNYALENHRNLSSLTCLRSAAPSVQSSTFGDYLGANVPSGTPKTLNVPSGATGYTSSYWNSRVVNKGFTLNATL